MRNIRSLPIAKLALPGGLQLFREPDREWLTLTRRGTISPTHLARRALPFLAQVLTAAEDNDIVLTIDCLGAEWEMHAEFTKKGLDAKAQEQIRILADMMPRRFDEYLSTTLNVTDTATLFASSTPKFSDALAIISVPFREAASWIEHADFPSTTEELLDSQLKGILSPSCRSGPSAVFPAKKEVERMHFSVASGREMSCRSDKDVVIQLARALAFRLGPIEHGGASTIETVSWRVADDRFAHQLVGAMNRVTS